ncbi:MAG: restriction endonuclease subunit S [Janthinobacterium lividum]
MAGKWKETTLGKISKEEHGLVDGPFGSNLPASSYVAEGIPVIRGSNLSVGEERFKGKDFVFVTEAFAKKLERSMCAPGDIIFTKKGTIGQTGIIPKNHEFNRFLLSSNQMKLSVDTEIADPLFVYYYVSSPASIAKVLQEANVAGVPKTNVAYFKQFPILLPPLDEQRRIAHILGTLDDKIELNRRQNETLESLARALFQSWFVDFDPVRAKASGEAEAAICQRLGLSPQVLALFPAALENSVLGEVPVEWEVSDLGSFLEVLETGRRPKGGVSGFSEGIPSVGAESIVGIGKFDFQKTKYVPSSFFEKMKSGLVNSEDVLLYKDGGKPGDFRPRVSMFGYGFPFEVFAINEHVFRLRSNELGQPFLYMQIGDERVLHELRHRGAKAAIPGINQSDVKSLKLVVPSVALLTLYNETAGAIFHQILLNASTNQQLAALRDELLPRLLSGELSMAAVTEEVYG